MQSTRQQSPVSPLEDEPFPRETGALSGAAPAPSHPAGIPRLRSIVADLARALIAEAWHPLGLRSFVAEEAARFLQETTPDEANLSRILEDARAIAQALRWYDGAVFRRSRVSALLQSFERELRSFEASLEELQAPLPARSA